MTEAPREIFANGSERGTWRWSDPGVVKYDHETAFTRTDIHKAEVEAAYRRGGREAWEMTAALLEAGTPPLEVARMARENAKCLRAETRDDGAL